MASQRKAETFTRWDVTEQLRAKENVCVYLEAAVEEDAGAGRLFRCSGQSPALLLRGFFGGRSLTFGTA